MKECIFCQIIDHKIPAKIRYEDEEIIAFDDIKPKAPIHILIVPKDHIESLTQARESDLKILGKLMLTAKKIAQKLKILNQGFKIIINTGKGGGQIVPHLHLHLLGGRTIKWEV